MWGLISSFRKRFRLKIDSVPRDRFDGFGALAEVFFFFGGDDRFLR